MTLNEFMKNAKDKIYAVGIKNAFIFIGTPKRYFELIDRISEEKLEMLNRLNAAMDDRIAQATSKNKKKYEQQKAKYERIIKAFTPYSEREIKETYPRNVAFPEPKPQTVVLISGEESGSFWTLSEFLEKYPDEEEEKWMRT